MTIRSGIYAIVNAKTGDRYIGSAVNLAGRWSVHRHLLRNGRHHSIHLQRAWDKYGGEAFHFEILEECKREMLIDAEQRFIDECRPEYNISPMAGSSIGRRCSDATRQKISAAHMGKKSDPEAVAKTAAENTGRVITPEWRAKISAALKGRPLSERHNGWVYTSPEYLAKQSASHMGKPAWNAGKKLSPAERAKCVNRRYATRDSP